MTSYLDEVGLAELWDLVNTRTDINEVLPKNAGAHNSVYRGKDITSKFTDGSLFTAIAAGTFDDVFVGDHFTIPCRQVSATIDSTTDPSNPVVVVTNGASMTNTKFIIAHLDKDLNKGDTAMNQHHAVVIPAVSLGTAPMNATNTTAGGYVGSAMYVQVLPVVKANLIEAFGSSHILKRRAYLSNDMTSGYASGGGWYDSYVELMPENEVYGCRMRSNTSNTAELYNTGCDYGQLACFDLNPETVTTRKDFWLRPVYNYWNFSHVYYSSNSGDHNTSIIVDVRPRHHQN